MGIAFWAFIAITFCVYSFFVLPSFSYGGASKTEQNLHQQPQKKTIDKEKAKLKLKRANDGEKGESQERRKLQKVSKNDAESFCDKVDRVMRDFAQFRSARMALIERIIRTQIVREEAEMRQITMPSQAKTQLAQFSLLKLKLFSGAKAIDSAMIGIEIAMLPFENLWHSDRGERVRMVDFMLERFTFLARAIMEMEGSAKEMVKGIIGMVRKRFMETGQRHLMMALDFLNLVEKIVDAIPSPTANAGDIPKNNLDFYIEYFSAILRTFSAPSVEAITNSSPLFQKLCGKIQMFSFSLVNEFKRIRNFLGE